MTKDKRRWRTDQATTSMAEFKSDLALRTKVPLKLPPDPDNQNGDRAMWAESALLEFMIQTGTDAEDAVADLLADLGHWCDRNGIVMSRQVQRAYAHYVAETNDKEAS